MFFKRSARQIPLVIPSILSSEVLDGAYRRERIFHFPIQSSISIIAIRTMMAVGFMKYPIKLRKTITPYFHHLFEVI